MGYYTDFELDYVTYPELDTVSWDIKRKIEKYLENQDLLNNLFNNCKWYEHDEDMGRLSLEFPDVLFTLLGYGEDRGDIWKAYYLNGKMQDTPAQIIFEEFSPELLEPINV